MTAREKFEARLRQWAEFNRWESEQPPTSRQPADIVADLGAILDWAPLEVLATDPDPEKRGIQAMRKALARLGPTR